MPTQPRRRPARTADRQPLPRPILTSRSATAAGWTRSAQRHAVGIGDLERVHRGVVAVASIQENGTRHRRALAEQAMLRSTQAAALVCPRATISHGAAAIAHGVATYGALARGCLTVPSGTALRELAGVHLHRATLDDSSVADVDGYRVTDVPRTVTDVARERGVPAGLVAADHALHHQLTSHDELNAALLRCAGWPGRRAARIVVALADGRAESPLESLSRLAIRVRHLRDPALQPLICDEHGRFLGRPDFYWDEFGVIGECDGELKYDPSGSALVAERRRQQELEDSGLIVVRWSWADLQEFDRVARRLSAAFGRGARPGSQHRRWGVLALHPLAPLPAARTAS